MCFFLLETKRFIALLRFLGGNQMNVWENLRKQKRVSRIDFDLPLWLRRRESWKVQLRRSQKAESSFFESPYPSVWVCCVKSVWPSYKHPIASHIVLIYFLFSFHFTQRWQEINLNRLTSCEHFIANGLMTMNQ